MDKFREILFNVWREACKHIEIWKSTEKISQMLLHHMPISYLIVRRIDQIRSSLETVAIGPKQACVDNIAMRMKLSKTQLHDLLVWCRDSPVLSIHPDDDYKGNLKFLIADVAADSVIFGPLGNNGLLMAICNGKEVFEARHITMMDILLEPFTVALDNDQRLHEMAALKEAAEADKRLLLTRLGRTDMADTIIGAEAGLRSVMERVDIVSRSDMPVLILGETGTGKELIARVIHKRSLRSQGPIMRVNCGAIPHELIDSELFGHERGAFTGATGTRKGWFERTDGGTLFLDEIGELPKAAQVRLLRVLQDGIIERVGGHATMTVDVRIVAATHCDLSEMVYEGSFREDLWYRIAVFPILLPALRYRTEDIALLADHLARKAAVRFGLTLQLPSEEDIEMLQSYAWPGNIRELGSVINRAVLIGDGQRLAMSQSLGIFNTGVISDRDPASINNTASLQSNSVQQSKTLSLDDVICQHIEKVLIKTNGRIDGAYGAAKQLGINPHTLRGRMRKLGIDWKNFRHK